MRLNVSCFAPGNASARHLVSMLQRSDISGLNTSALVCNKSCVI